MTIFPCFIFGDKGQKNVFYDNLERNNAFLGYKNKKFKQSNTKKLPKGVSRWFWSNIDHFSMFSFFGNIAQENVFYDILAQKRLSRLWQQELRKVEKLRFFKTGWPIILVQKWPFFKLFFRQFRPRICLLRYSTTKQPLSRL